MLPGIVMAAIYSKDDQMKVERLYRAYQRTMYYVAYEILQDHYLAEDAVHQAFLRIITVLPRIHEHNGHKTKGFLVVVCRNVAYDIYKQRMHTVEEDFANLVDDGAMDSLELVIQDEFIEELTGCIQQLKPIYRDIIILRYAHELTYEEIAAVLQISNAAVRKRIERARKMLIPLLRKKEEKIG